ncbi:ankyrin repeat domain-containing protein 40-like isoform X2 [Indicator indicator]|uniref:ankyrin repeat domain-containing protein 40-like isoform X2 n=1 Tax=Indicator indicator TaxID=1002788 RepID=UPI0023DFED5D|nr:ankyrin repeat domain-containing protein 40-like isoform X2 [Indicator indicator]
MSGAAERELEERLREAAALGDVEEVRRLLGAGADINSRNEINGWTCLHWACKRNHAQVVSCLLAAGANRQILTARGELAAELTVKADIRKMLGATQPDSAGTPTSCSSPEDFPAVAAPPSPVGQPSSPPSPCLHPGPSLCLPHSTSPCLPAAAPPHPSSLPLAPAAAFQPLFFTGTFPCNMQELVLKVRVQNLRDSDFIEIELDRQELTYRDLLRVSCCELGVNPEQVEKIRKLPNTLVRKDKDVARLQDFQELELVLLRSTTSPLTGRACYSSSASRLTY